MKSFYNVPNFISLLFCWGENCYFLRFFMNKDSIFRIDLQYNISHVKILCVTLLKSIYIYTFCMGKTRNSHCNMKEQLNNMNIKMHSRAKATAIFRFYSLTLAFSTLHCCLFLLIFGTFAVLRQKWAENCSCNCELIWITSVN